MCIETDSKKVKRYPKNFPNTYLIIKQIPKHITHLHAIIYILFIRSRQSFSIDQK